ncbi:MAG: sarcosine oxidase subunit gamma family protein [Granulosicoccaceae bacterium]
MSDFNFVSQPVLGGFSQESQGVSITEQISLGIVSVACPNNGDEALAASAKKAFCCSLPDVSGVEVSDGGTMRWLGLQPQQWFVLFEHGADQGDPLAIIKDQLGDTAYCTDQSDSWVSLEISGPLAISALERICPIDLHPAVFPVAAVARTTMEHLGVIITRTGDDQFLMMSAASSADSFLHAITTSVKNITA